ncbi:MAG: hypothetical protein ACKVS6_12025 [Planctomycetota bacterium]
MLILARIEQSHSADFVAGAGLFIVFNYLFCKIAPAAHLLDIPSGRHTHSKPVPRTGGLAIAAAVIASMLMLGIDRTGRVWIFSFLILCTGVFDDALRERFPWWIKFSLQIGISAWFSAVEFPDSIIYSTILLVVGMNAFNFIDHANGIFAISILPVALISGSPEAVILAGALAAFFIFNRTGRVFAGDAGTHAISFFVISQLMQTHRTDASLYYFPLLAISFVLLDLIIVTSIRILRGAAPWNSTPDHVMHRLLRAGFSANIALFAIAAFCFLIAMTLAVHRNGSGLDSYSWVMLVTFIPLQLSILLRGSPPCRRSRPYESG